MPILKSLILFNTCVDVKLKATCTYTPNMFVAGLELEIENATKLSTPANFFMDCIEDGSLRHDGLEFITWPGSKNYLVDGLSKFYSKNVWEASNFSDRCSIHVHVNVQEIETGHLANLLLLYYCFERSFFQYVDPGRVHNVYCIPLSETEGSTDLKQFIKTDDPAALFMILRNWEKYMALNLIPIRKQGSIEFRHMHGNADFPYIVNWLNLLDDLYTTSIKMKKETIVSYIKKLNSLSNYKEFTNKVFPNTSKIIVDMPTFTDDLYTGVTRVKELLI